MLFMVALVICYSNFYNVVNSNGILIYFFIIVDVVLSKRSYKVPEFKEFYKLRLSLVLMILFGYQFILLYRIRSSFIVLS